jgi:hypothetical protein
MEPACDVCVSRALPAYIYAWRGSFLPANCTSTLLCSSRAHRSPSSVNIGGHRILLFKSGEDPGNGQIAIEVVKFEVLPYQHHFLMAIHA